MMKPVFALVGCVTGMAAIVTLTSTSYSAQPVIPKPVIPTVGFLRNNTQLALTWSGRKTIVNASSLKANVLDGDCRGTLPPRQPLSGQRFSGSRAFSIDPLTGNVAIGVVLKDCASSLVSVVFVIDPQAPGAYNVSLLQLPGSRALTDATSTFPLDRIRRVRYLDGDLLVKNSSIVLDNEDLLVFTATRPRRDDPPVTMPTFKYVGCVNTRLEDGQSRCPEGRSY